MPHKGNTKPQRFNNQNKSQKDEEDTTIHYKKNRKNQRMEKSLRSTYGNDLNQSDYQEYQTKNSKKQFNSYDVDEDEFYSTQPQKQYQKDQGYEHDYNQQNRKRSDSSDSQDLLKQYENKGPQKRRTQRQGQKGKKNFRGFDDHLSTDQIQKGIQEFEIFTGILMIQEERGRFGTIKSPFFEQKVLLDDIESQNRAFNGAEVAFQIIKVLQNDRGKDRQYKDTLYKEKEQQSQYQEVKKIQKDQLPEGDIKLNEQNSDWSNEEDDDDEEQIQKIIPKNKQTPIINNQIKILQQKYKDKKLIGQIVGIITDLTRTKDLVGKIDIMRKNLKQRFQEGSDFMDTIRKNYHVTFKSINKRIPWFNIGQFEVNMLNQFIQGKDTSNIEQILDPIRNNYFKAKFSKWEIDSVYPFVEITGKIGLSGDIEIECQALLTEYQIHTDDFSEECNNSMLDHKQKCNEEGEYIIPTEERAKRLDLTNEIICTVDPVTARDLDDALSVKEVEKDIFEIGVHIADVSHFVEMDSLVDFEAQLRTTSVYLVHRVIPMLPRILCENLCSLNPGVERLAFSIFFYISKDGVVLWERPIRYHKTIIKSCVKFSYDVVNELIEGKIDNLDKLPEQYQIIPSVDKIQLYKDIMLLNELGQKRRNHRLLEGSLVLESHKLRFRLDKDSVPIEYQSEQRKQAQFMVEEWMLLANQFVGMQLVKFDKSTAVLRQHQPPQQPKIIYFKKQLQICNLLSMVEDFDISNSQKLQNTLNLINENKDIRQDVKDILSFKIVRLLEAAKYFVVGDAEPEQWHHYALNFAVYTHFTSPIRRYPDILVHRLLFETIAQTQNLKQIEDNTTTAINIMNKCNLSKLSARRVSEGCEKIFMCLYLKYNPVVTEGFVLEVSSLVICIIIPIFNLEIKKKVSELKNVKRCQYIKGLITEKESSYLLIEYQDNYDPKARRAFIVKALTKIKIKISSNNSFPIDYQVNIVVDQRKLGQQGTIEIQTHLL